MIRIALRVLLPLSLAFVAVTSEAHSRAHTDAEIARAQRLVGQSRRLVTQAHRRHPREFGGHEAKAAEYLRRAALQLNEAHDFKTYHAVRTVHTGHRSK